MVRPDRVVRVGVVGIGGVQSLQPQIEVTGSVNGYSAVGNDHAGEALTELGVHVLLGGAIGQLGPDGNSLEIAENQAATRLRIGMRHTADYGGRGATTRRG